MIFQVSRGSVHIEKGGSQIATLDSKKYGGIFGELVFSSTVQLLSALFLICSLVAVIHSRQDSKRDGYFRRRYCPDDHRGLLPCYPFPTLPIFGGKVNPFLCPFFFALFSSYF